MCVYLCLYSFLGKVIIIVDSYDNSNICCSLINILDIVSSIVYAVYMTLFTDLVMYRDPMRT